jgi:hypothetical protein
LVFVCIGYQIQDDIVDGVFKTTVHGHVLPGFEETDPVPEEFNMVKDPGSYWMEGGMIELVQGAVTLVMAASTAIPLCFPKRRESFMIFVTRWPKDLASTLRLIAMSFKQGWNATGSIRANGLIPTSVNTRLRSAPLVPRVARDISRFEASRLLSSLRRIYYLIALPDLSLRSTYCLNNCIIYPLADNV